MDTIGMVMVYILLSLIYSAFWFKKDRDEGIYRLTVVLFMPFLGFVFLVISSVLSKLNESADGKIKHELEVSNKNSIINIYKNVDSNKVTNIIPVEEALLMNDSSIKRQLLIDVVKKDALDYIKFLKQALNDNDTETSHYAASAVTEVKRKLTITLQEFSQKYEAYGMSLKRINRKQIDDDSDGDSEDNEIDISTDMLVSCADVLEKYLASELLDEQSHIKYSSMYCNVLKEIIKSEIASERHFVALIDHYLENKDFLQAEEYCKKFKGFYYNSEKVYLMELKLYYFKHDYNGFQRALALLMHSNIRISNLALNIIRFWSKESEVFR